MQSPAPGPGLIEVGLAFCAFLIIVSFFTLADPGTQVYASLPMVLLSLCPLIRLRGRRRPPAAPLRSLGPS